jgi:V8-like Glu-specific endopeptidase
MTRVQAPSAERQQASFPPPFSPDDILQKDNIPAESAMPSDVATQLAEAVVHVSTANRETNLAKLSLKNNSGKSASLRLPAGAYLGQAMQSAEFFTVKTLPRINDSSSILPSRPKWFPHIFHPKQAATRQAPPLRRFSGKPLVPDILFPPENRQAYLPQGYPWHCIGRLFVWDNANAANPRGSGTAVLVGPRVILTASHMLPIGAASWKCLFVPGYFNGNPVAGAGAASWCSDFRGFRFEPDDQAFDMGVLRLYDPLGANIGWMGSRVYSSSWQDQPYWTLCGYPGDLTGGERPTREQGIRVIDDDSDGDFLEIEHRGDTNDGNSGGPLWATWDDGPYVIGTHSGGEQHSWPDYENHNVAAGGKGMVDLIRWAQTTWP